MWRFTCVTAFHQRIAWDALVIEGNQDELILGNDFQQRVGTTIDFEAREMMYMASNAVRGVSDARQHGASRDGDTEHAESGERASDETVIVPFECRLGGNSVRLV